MFKRDWKKFAEVNIAKILPIIKKRKVNRLHTICP